MGSCKTEPDSNPNPVGFRNPPQPKSPLEALRYRTRSSSREFPVGVSYCRTSQGISVSLSFNGVLYSACEQYSKYAVQKLAVYILFGEFDQDAVELYNYHLRKDNKDKKDAESLLASMFLDSETVSLAVQSLKNATPVEASKKSKRDKKKENSGTYQHDNTGRVLSVNTQRNFMPPDEGISRDSEKSRKRKSG